MTSDWLHKYHPRYSKACRTSLRFLTLLPLLLLLVACGTRHLRPGIKNTGNSTHAASIGPAPFPHSFAESSSCCLRDRPMARNIYHRKCKHIYIYILHRSCSVSSLFCSLFFFFLLLAGLAPDTCRQWRYNDTVMTSYTCLRVHEPDPLPQSLA